MKDYKKENIDLENENSKFIALQKEAEEKNKNLIHPNTLKVCRCIDCGEPILVKTSTNPRYVRCGGCKIQYQKLSKKENESQLIKKLKEKRLQDSGHFVCEHCGKEFTEDYRTGLSSVRKKAPRFCSKICSKKYSSDHLQRDRTKPATCTRCGKVENIPISASSKTFVCKECKNPSKHVKEGFEKFINSQFYTKKSPNLIRFGFNFNNPNAEEEYNNLKNKLYDLYFVQNLSSLEISKIFNFNAGSGILNRLFKVFGFRMRTLGEANTLAVKEGRLKIDTSNIFINHPSHHPLYNQGYLTLYEGTDKEKQFYYRSSYEKSFLKKLEYLNISFECNTYHIDYFDTQENKLRKGFPDFYFPKHNVCIEIKGEHFYDEINLRDRFEALKKKDINLFILFYKSKEKRFFLRKAFIVNNSTESLFKEEVLNFLISPID